MTNRSLDEQTVFMFFFVWFYFLCACMHRLPAVIDRDWDVHEPSPHPPFLPSPTPLIIIMPRSRPLTLGFRFELCFFSLRYYYCYYSVGFLPPPSPFPYRSFYFFGGEEVFFPIPPLLSRQFVLSKGRGN